MNDVTMIMIALQAVTTICFTLIVFIVNGFKDTVDKLKTSVVDLNITIVKLVEKDVNKDDKLKDHDGSINKLKEDVSRMRERHHEVVNDVSSKVELMYLDVAHLKKKIETLDSISNG